jgi:putative ABC transport system substrate-binding protein
VTGLSALSEAMTAKEISLLGEILPGPKTLAILIDATVPAAPNIERRAREAAEAIQARLVVHAVKDRPALEQALARIERDRPDAAVITVSGLLNASRDLIIDTMLRLRLPAVGLGAGQERPGVLFYYRPSGPWLWRRAGWYAAQVLKGARPVDLPVEQPSVFELVLNLKTARALDIGIPPTILVRAHRLIQ